jgi:hypothetical protein
LKVREIYQQLEKTAFVSDGVNYTQAKDQCLEYANRLTTSNFHKKREIFSTAVLL